MNDFDYEVSQKRKIASQARYRKNGSKSKKCMLSTDYMTKKQLKERCGEVMSYNFNQPMSWKQFSVLPVKIQKEYLLWLIDQYSVTACDLAKMFDITPQTVRKRCNSEEIDIQFKHGGRMPKDKKRAFEAYCGIERVDRVPALNPICFEENQPEATFQDTITCEKPENIPSKLVEEICAAYEQAMRPTEEKPQQKETRQPMGMSEFSIRFSGAFSKDMICNSLAMLLPEGTNAQIEVKCVVEKNPG